MGAGRSIIRVGNTTVNLNEYTCSDRGLILPIINEYTWPVWLRGLLYFLGLLYIFLGIAIICDIFMCAIEKITSKVQIIKIPDPNDPTGKAVIDKEVKV
jgi:solute carrier family 8 (sodium/calcium exchanger)